MFTRPGQLDMFVTIPMYEYLIEKGLSQKNFIPAYYSGVLKKVAGYQLKAENVLRKGAFQCESYRATEACSHCKKSASSKKNQMRDFIIFIWIQKNWGNGSMSMQRMNIHTDMPEGF